MRIGVVSDVHANLVALEAVEDAMPAVDAVVCVGDVVGYNPWPGECVDRVRDSGWPTVQGNHDRTVETPERYVHNEMACAGLELAKERLTREQRDWLAGLPDARTEFDGRVRMVHSHPTRRGRYVYPDEFAGLASLCGPEDVLLLGHTHVPGSERVGGTLVVNPGSVGQPRDGDPRASFAVITLPDDTDDTDDNGDNGDNGEKHDDEVTTAATVEHRRVRYDVERVQAAIREAGLPDRTAARLERGQ